MNNEFKGTNGKWEFRDGYAMDIVTSDSRSFGIVNLGTEQDAFLADYPLVELKSNAKLIACAPEMLDMLKNVKEYLENITGKHLSKPLANEIEQLIKKATL